MHASYPQPRVLVIQPDGYVQAYAKDPREWHGEQALEDLQAAVEGFIEVLPTSAYRRTRRIGLAFVNEEGGPTLMDLTPNTHATGYLGWTGPVLRGPVVVLLDFPAKWGFTHDCVGDCEHREVPT